LLNEHNNEKVKGFGKINEYYGIRSQNIRITKRQRQDMSTGGAKIIEKEGGAVVLARKR
jgi:hypothetical protein